MALAMRERRWKPFHNALLDKSDIKDFDKTFDIPRPYLFAYSSFFFFSSFSSCTQTVRIYSILISILLHCLKLLCNSLRHVKWLFSNIGEEEVYNEPISR
jgi:hypothetical protein